MGSWTRTHGWSRQTGELKSSSAQAGRGRRGAERRQGFVKTVAGPSGLRAHPYFKYQLDKQNKNQRGKQGARLSYQKGFQWYLPCPPVPLKFVAGGGEGTVPSPAEWLPATAGDGLCVINLQANPPVVAARQIKELTHLCLKPAAKGSWEESRVGVGERARERACVLLIDKKGRASSSERSQAPSKCRRRRRGKKKDFLSLTGACQNPAAFNRRGGHCYGGQVSPQPGLEGERIAGSGIATARRAREPGCWLPALPRVGRMEGLLRFALGILCKARICRSTQKEEVSHLPHLLLQHL